MNTPTPPRTFSEAFGLPPGSFVKHLDESKASGMSPEERSMTLDLPPQEKFLPILNEELHEAMKLHYFKTPKDPETKIAYLGEREFRRFVDEVLLYHAYNPKEVPYFDGFQIFHVRAETHFRVFVL